MLQHVFSHRNILPVRRIILSSCCKPSPNCRKLIVTPYSKYPLNQHRLLKTSSTNHAAPVLGPLLVKLATPISRIAFVLVGRRFRNWWNSLPPDRKNRYLGILSKSRNRLLASVLAFGGISFSYYVYHLEEAPVTHRKRFMILNQEQMEKIAAMEWKMIGEGFEKSTLSTHHPMHKRVFKIVRRILSANQSREISGLTWEVNVIENADVNAFVLGNGKIYVFTGIVNAVKNDDELAGILGHEIAHAILNHTAEQVSLSSFVNLYSVAIVALLWAIIPTDGFAVLASVLQNYVEELLVSLPYSRKLEKEADEVGLLLAARACYDIRYVPRFWNRMQHSAEHGMQTANVDWFSTHPTNDSRVKWLDSLLPDALALRRDFYCPQLSEFLQISYNMTR